MCHDLSATPPPTYRTPCGQVGHRPRSVATASSTAVSSASTASVTASSAASSAFWKLEHAGHHGIDGEAVGASRLDHLASDSWRRGHLE